jgi:hypothetical protein
MAKTKRHSAEQIIRKLREAETMLAAGKSVGDVLGQTRSVQRYVLKVRQPIMFSFEARSPCLLAGLA